MKLVSAVAVVIASAIALTSTGASAAGDGQLYIDPQSSYVAPGQVFEVDLISVPPDESLAAWVVRVHFDPTVIAFQACSSVGVPPGYIGVSDCGLSILGPTEAAVSLGAFLDPNLEIGLVTTTVLMTVTFEALGAVPSSTDLDIEIMDYLGPNPNAPSLSPTVMDGYVEITNDPPPPPTPSPTPPPPATATPSPTPMPIGGTVTLTTTPPMTSSNLLPITLPAATTIATALAALRLTRRPRP